MLILLLSPTNHDESVKMNHGNNKCSTVEQVWSLQYLDDQCHKFYDMVHDGPIYFSAEKLANYINEMLTDDFDCPNGECVGPITRCKHIEITTKLPVTADYIKKLKSFAYI